MDEKNRSSNLKIVIKIEYSLRARGHLWWRDQELGAWK